MPTVAEMQLLNNSLDDLGRTLQGNRAITLNERERGARLDLDREMMGLRKEEMGLRRNDASEARANRGLLLQSQAAHQQRLEAIQKEGNETKRNQMYLEFLGELNKTGQLTDEGLAKMEEKFNEQFGATGLGVKLFRRAEPVEPRIKELGDGVRAAWMPGSKDMSTFDDRATVTEEVDELTGQPKRKLSRKISGSGLDKAMQDLAPKPGGDLSGALREGKAAPLQKELTEHLEAIKKGDTDYGFLNGKDRVARVKELQARMAELDLPEATLTNVTPGPMTAPQTNVLPDKVSGTQQFESVGQAREAGKKSGDIILLWDGQQKRYRKFQLD